MARVFQHRCQTGGQLGLGATHGPYQQMDIEQQTHRGAQRTWNSSAISAALN
jgi:hypothetical protein